MATKNLAVSGLELHFRGTKPFTFFGAKSPLGESNSRLGSHKLCQGGHGPGIPPMAPSLSRCDDCVRGVCPHHRKNVKTCKCKFCKGSGFATNCLNFLPSFICRLLSYLYSLSGHCVFFIFNTLFANTNLQCLRKKDNFTQCRQNVDRSATTYVFLEVLMTVNQATRSPSLLLLLKIVQNSAVGFRH